MKLAILAIGALLLTAAQAADDSGEALIQRTKTTTATYSLYSWMVQRDDEGEPNDTWAAEFNSGDWHRVEGDKFRVIANCRTHEGHIYDVAAGTTQESDTAWVGACGVATGAQILSVDRVASIPSKYGPLSVVRITQKGWVRLYAIDANGVLVRAQWSASNGSPAPCIQSEPIAVLTSLPRKDMFTTASLAVPAVPPRYQVRPKDFPTAGLAGKACGAIG